MDNVSVNRRTLVKGATWAAPVVVSTSIIPAYAASRCVQTADANTDIKNYELNEGKANQNSAIWFDFGDVTATIPAGRTVVSVTTGFWIEKHSGTNDGRNRGYPSPSSKYMQYYGANAAGTGPTLKSTGASSTSGSFYNFTTNIRIDPSAPVGPSYPFKYLGEATQTWSDGSSGTGWGLETTWTPGDSRKETYTPDGDYCQTFSLIGLGGIQWAAQGIYIPLNRELPHWRYWKVTLDDETVLEGKEVKGWIGDPEYVRNNS